MEQILTQTELACVYNPFSQESSDIPMVWAFFQLKPGMKYFWHSLCAQLTPYSSWKTLPWKRTAQRSQRHGQKKRASTRESAKKVRYCDGGDGGDVSVHISKDLAYNTSCLVSLNTIVVPSEYCILSETSNLLACGPSPARQVPFRRRINQFLKKSCDLPIVLRLCPATTKRRNWWHYLCRSRTPSSRWPV